MRHSLMAVGGKVSAVEAGWLRGPEGVTAGVDSRAGGQEASPGPIPPLPAFPVDLW